jgi:pyrophosphatase PpaX
VSDNGGSILDSSTPQAPVQAVIFDLDGTLIDSMPLVLKAFAHALAPFRPDLDEEAIFHRLGGPPERTLLELVGDQRSAGEALRRLQSFGFEDGGLVRPFDGMRDLLERLRTRRLSLAVWTGRDRHTTGLIFNAHRLGAFFPLAICGDDLATHKPHPEGLIHLLRELRMGPEHALYVGDADADVLGGAEAGVRTVLISHRRDVRPDVASLAWSVVDTPEQAYRLIADITGTSGGGALL